MSRPSLIATVAACFTLLIPGPHAYAQQKTRYSPAIEEKIKAVEQNLISWVKLDSPVNWNIHDRMRDLHINAVSIAVISNYRIEWAKAYGWADSAEQRAATPETLFQSASIGKSINGFAFTKLVQDKKVDLLTDINTYLRRWKFPYDTASRGQKIHLAGLLSHSAGLTVHGFDGYQWNQPLPTLLQMLDGRSPANNPAVRSRRTPGQQFEYSGGGYQISELLLEDVMHEPYDEYIRRTVFGPLKMHNSFYAARLPGNKEKKAATAYRWDGQPIGCKYHLYPEKACGAGLWTTATDLARFVIEVQRALQGQVATLIYQASARRMLTPYLPASNAGFGFFIDKKGDQTYFSHSGLNEGFSSQYYGSLQGGNGVVVLVNSDHTAFKDEIVNSVATVYGWKDFYPFVSKKIIAVADSVLDRYVGSYTFENATRGPSIGRQGGALYLKDPDAREAWRMYFTSEREFFLLEASWANQQFFMDEHGQIDGFYILGDKFKARVNRE